MSEERDTELASVGQKLAKANAKEALMTLLPKAATMLEEVEQSPPSSTIFAMKACSDALVDPALLRHKDKDVGLLVALCISEIMRIVAPDAPYSDDCLKEIFQLIVDIFRELDDVDSPFFSSRVNILETVAKVRSCVVMLDLECDDLITEMFRIFFTTASDKHPEHVFLAMRNVLSLVIEEGEEVSSQILEIILNNLLRQKEGVSEAGHKLAVAVVENSADNLEPYVRTFLTLVILEGRGLQTGLKKDYHEIIYEIYSCAPQMLLAVLPYLKEELVSNQVTVRLNATMLLGRMFALPDRQVANGYQQLFSEFLKRLNDEDADVQIAAVNCAKACLETMNSSAVETSEILVALGDQLLHFDDGVRISVMNIICDFARANLNFNPPGILQKVGDCLQDTKTSIGIETLLKLASVYRSYCTKSFKGFKAVHDEFEWIPSKILCCCYRKGAADDFKLLDPEIAIFEELFDADLPVEEQAKHWITFFSLFDEQDKIALQHILSHKQRLQLEMVVYLSELRTAKEKDTPEFQKRLQSTFTTIAQQFADPKKAEEDLKKLHNMSDVTVFKELSSLLDPSTTTAHAHTVCAELLKKIGEDNPQHNFLKTLATKCAYSLFSREHAHAFLQEFLINKDSATKEQTISTLDLLGEVAAYCPTLMEDLKEKLELLAKDDKEFIRKGVLKIISNKAGSSFHEGMAGSEVSSKLEATAEEDFFVQEEEDHSSRDILHKSLQQSSPKGLKQGQAVGDGEVLSEDEKEAVDEVNHKGGDHDNNVMAKGASGVETTSSGKDPLEDEEEEKEQEENVPEKRKRGRPKGSAKKKPSSGRTKTTGKVIGPKKMSVAVGMEHGEIEEDKNLPPQLECGQPEGSSNKKDGNDDVLEEAEKDGVEEHEEEHHHVKNPEEDGMNNNNHEKDDTVKDVEDVMNAGKQDHELNDLQVRVKEKVQDIKEDGAEVQHNVVAISKDNENEEAKIDEKDAAKDGIQDKEDEIEAHVVDKVEDPEEQEVRDHEKDDGVVQQQHEEKRQVTTGHEVEGEERREPAKDGTGDHAGDKSEDNMENATNHNSDHGSKHSEGDVVKDSVEDERSNEENGLQVQDGGPVKDPHKGEIEEKPAGLDLDLDHKEDGKTFDGSQKENDAGDSKDTDVQEGNVKDDHKEVTVEDDNKEVTVVEGTTNKGGLGDLQVADEANSHEDEKGLSQKEEDAGVDHKDGSEGHKQERVDDQAEEETKGEIGVKGSKEDSKDGQEDDGVIPQRPDTLNPKPEESEQGKEEDKEKTQKSDTGEVEDEEEGGGDDQQVNFLSAKQKRGRPKGSGRKPKRRHTRGSGKKDAKKTVTLEVEKDGQTDPESTGGKDTEKGGGQEEALPQKLSLKDAGEEKDQEGSLHKKRKRGRPVSFGEGNAAGATPRNETDGETEPGKETMENDREDHDENLPAKRTHLPEGSSKNHHVRDLSSEDKKDEEEGGEDDQDVDQTPQQSDEKEHEKDLVENLSTKRKPGQGSKRKLPVGDGRAHKSREENVDPKRKRGLPENSIKKGEVLDEDVNNGRNQQELDVSPPKSKHKLPKNSVDKGIEYVLNGHDKDGDMDTEENLTPKSKAGHAKASGKKESRRVSSGKGGKQEEKEEGGDQTPKHKAGCPKGGSGGKEITYPSGGDEKKAGEKDKETHVFTRRKPGQPKGSINVAGRELSSGDEKATSSAQKSPAWKSAADRGGDEGLVGCGIKVWWPLDRRFYKGEVVSYNAKKKKHKVLYDDGEQEILDLVQERWELITKKQRPVKNPPDASPTPAWAPVPLKELTKAKALAQQEDVQRPSDKVKKQSLSKSGKKDVSKEGKPNNLEAKFLEAKSPVNTISAFDFDEDDDGEAPRGGKTKRKSTQSSSTPKGSSGKIFKLVSSTKTSAKDDSSDTLGDGEPLNTWVIQRQKAR